MDAVQTVEPSRSYDVIVLGAGYAGLMAALRLGRRKWGLRIALVSAFDRFLERVRLQETIVAEVAPRIPSIAALVQGTPITFIAGRVVALDAAQRRVRIATPAGEQDIAFEEAIYALGSSIEVETVAGEGAHAYRLEAGEGPRSAAALRARLRQNGSRRLRVVVVGGAETAVEAAGEIKTAWPATEVIMISRSRCGAFKGARVEQSIRAALTGLGVTLIDHETVAEVRADAVITAAGRPIACDICVWSGGLAAPPLARAAGIATDAQGRIFVDPNLRSISHPHIRAIGDAAHPIAPTGAPYRISAFVALATGAYAADAVAAQRRGRTMAPFAFSTFGQGIAVGRGGVGFFSYPDDQQRFFIVTNKTARHIRNFFVWLVCAVLKMERKMPGSFFWLGRRRVSWRTANEAMQNGPAARKVQAA
jgi:NADH dehydrogenase